jgi:hypothetical protein
MDKFIFRKVGVRNSPQLDFFRLGIFEFRNCLTLSKEWTGWINSQKLYLIPMVGPANPL